MSGEKKRKKKKRYLHSIVLVQSHLAVPDGQTKSKESVRDSELSGTAGYDLVKNNLQLREFHPG